MAISKNEMKRDKSVPELLLLLDKCHPQSNMETYRIKYMHKELLN